MNIPAYLVPIIGAILGIAIDYLNYAAFARDNYEQGRPEGSWKWELALQRALIGAAAAYGISLAGGLQA